MWDVRSRGEEGQLILVGALSLAIVLVGIALVLNASIFAENLATRANQQETADVVALEGEAHSGTGFAMEHLHHQPDAHERYGDLEDGLRTEVDNWADVTVRDRARDGQYVDLEYLSMTNGTRVAQDDGTEFEPQSTDLLDEIYNLAGVDTWAATPDKGKVRDFSLSAPRSEIGDGVYAQVDVETFLLDLGGTISVSPRPFTIGYNTDGPSNQVPEHSVAIYRPADSDGDSNDVKMTHLNHATGVTTTCEVSLEGSELRLDVSNGVVEGAGTACQDVFDFQSSLGEHQLVFIQPKQIEGDYEFIVDDEISQFRDDYEESGGLLDNFINLLGLGAEDFDDYYDDHSDGHGGSYSPSSPYVEPAIYSAEVGLDYRSDSMSYESTLTVAPNEP